MDLRKMLKSSLSGIDKSINAIYKKLQKNLTSEELLPSLWDKCKRLVILEQISPRASTMELLLNWAPYIHITHL